MHEQEPSLYGNDVTPELCLLFDKSTNINLITVMTNTRLRSRVGSRDVWRAGGEGCLSMLECSVCAHDLCFLCATVLAWPVCIHLGVLPRWIAPSPTGIFVTVKTPGPLSTQTVFLHAFHFFPPRMYVV